MGLVRLKPATHEVFWQSILFVDDTLIYIYGHSPTVPYVSLVAQYNGLGNLFCSIFLSLVGVVGAVFSVHILHHVWQTSRDKWIISGVVLNLFLGLHDVAWMLHLIFYAFPLISLSFVVEIMRMTFQMQSASVRLVDKLEDEVNYLTQVSRAGFAVGQICHDIRNPLAVIEGHHRLITRSLANFDDSQERIMISNNKIAASSKRIGVILDNYLGEIYHTSDPKYEEITLKKVVEEAIELCSEKAKTAGVSKITNECSESDLVFGVENQLVMAFVNLLSNSCDAIENLDERWISIRCFREGSAKFTIQVVDSGSGISRQLESNIFERSFTTKEKGKGTGLGLSFVKKVIDAHHGSIYIDHNFKNTCFVIILPRKEAIATGQKMAV